MQEQPLETSQILKNQTWAKAFVMLNQRPHQERERIQRLYRWGQLVLPKQWLAKKLLSN